jgi:hypothetical protein
MNTFSRLSIILSIIVYSHLQATHNFDLNNAEPKKPIYVQANGGPWQVLNKEHYRYPVNVPENNLLIMSLSANEDKSATITILFSPEKVRDAAQQVGIKTTYTPTFYVDATVIIQKDPHSTKTINLIKLTPQKGTGKSNKTKSGLSLEHNVTQGIIDTMVSITKQEPVEPQDTPVAEPPQSLPEEIAQKTLQSDLTIQKNNEPQDIPVKRKRLSAKRHITNRKSIV